MSATIDFAGRVGIFTFNFVKGAGRVGMVGTWLFLPRRTGAFNCPTLAVGRVGNCKLFTVGRTGIFTSNGDVSDGPLDDYIARSMRILVT